MCLSSSLSLLGGLGVRCSASDRFIPVRFPAPASKPPVSETDIYCGNDVELELVAPSFHSNSSRLVWPARGQWQWSRRGQVRSVSGRTVSSLEGTLNVRLKFCRMPGISRSDGRGQGPRNKLSLAWALIPEIHPCIPFGLISKNNNKNINMKVMIKDRF